MAIDQPPVVETVVVQPARLPPAAGDVAFSIVQLTPEDLNAQPRLDEVLTNVPGVELFRRTSSLGANPTTQGISLRNIAGSGAGRALVTLDGVPQNDPFGGWVIWSSIPSEILEGARIVRGAGAGPYGAGALTGTVSLDERVTVPGGFAGELAFGELGYRRGAAVVDGGWGSNRLLVSASTESSDGWIPVEEGERGAADTPLALDTINTSARLQVPVGSSVLAVRASAYREKREGGLEFVNSRAEGFSGSVTLASAPTAQSLGWRVQGWIRGSDLVNNFASVSDDRSSTSPANNQYAAPATGYGFNAALRGPAGAFNWEIGGDARLTVGEVKEQSRLIGNAFFRNRNAGGRTFVGGGYVEGSRTSGDWLFTGGVRVDYWRSYNAFRVETDRLTNTTSLDITPDDDSGLIPTGRLGARLELANDMYWRTAAYAGFRAPTLNELHRPFRVGNDITEANTALEPERLYGIETGLGGQVFGAGSWNLGVFYNRLEDAITNVTIGVGPGTFPIAGFVPAGGVLRQRQNAGAVKAFGVEFDAQRPLTETLDLNLAAGFTRARVDGGEVAPQLTGLRPAQTPRFTAIAGLRWQALEPLTMQMDVRYESSRFDDDTNTRVLDSAVTVDARVEWRMAGQVGVFAAVDNLFDANVETAVTETGVRSFTQPQTFRMGLAIRR